MTDHPTVPSAAVMADMTAVELEALCLDLEAAIESCTLAIDRRNQQGLASHTIESARRHYTHGIKAARSLLRVRSGEPIQYGPARPVHTFETAYMTLKAVNRLVGLCHMLYEAVGAWIDLDDETDGYDEAVEAIERAHADVERALTCGGVE
jgi:hypothetical protein